MRTSTYHCDPEKGVIYNQFGVVVGRKASTGYIRITKRNYYALAHRMIWESVHGPIPEGMEINHKNGIKTDNRLENLELVTPSENIRHAYRIGLNSAQGTSNGRAILTPSAVREIRQSNASQRSLARAYGVGRTTIRDIQSGKNWSHVI